MLIQAFKGIRNDVPQDRFDVAEDGSVDLSAGLNVVIDNSFKVSRRQGYSQMIAGNVHSIWADNELCFFVEDQRLYSVAADFSVTLVRGDLMLNQPMSYARIDDSVYYVNGFQSGVIEGNINRSFGLEVPDAMAAQEVAGDLASGVYQHAVTFIRDDAQESGANTGTPITITSGGISFSNIPVSDDPTVTRKVIYLSEPDGMVMYEAIVIDNADTAATITDAVLAVALDTQHLCKPPVGHMVAIHRGHMFVADDRTLYRSKAYSNELFDLLDFVSFEAKITMLASVDGGMFIGTERETGLISGSTPDDFEYTNKTDYGIVEGSLAYTTTRKLGFDGVDESSVAIWKSKQGVCVGMASGAIYNLTEPKYQYDETDSRAAGVILDVDGSSVFVTTT